FLSKGAGLPFLAGQSRHKLVQSVAAADIVHVHTIWNPINVDVRQACALHRRPYVLMPHGMLDPYSLSVKRWRKAGYLRLIERRNILAAKRVVCTTAEEARLAKPKLWNVPTVVIPLGGDAPSQDRMELTSRFLEGFPAARGRRRLLFLG